MRAELLSTARALGLLRMGRLFNGGRPVVLTYHGVLSGSDERPDFLSQNCVSASMFERHMTLLQTHYTPVSLPALVDCYRQGVPPPPRAVAITFDDGFENNYAVAYPILRERNIPFTVFVTTGLVGSPGAQLWTERVKRSVYLADCDRIALDIEGLVLDLPLATTAQRQAATLRVLSAMKRLNLQKRDAAIGTIEERYGRPAMREEDRERYQFMSWSQVKTLSDDGVTIGSHTITHPILTSIDEPSVVHELTASRHEIEQRTGRPCRLFAYPNGQPGDYGAREQRILESAGYDASFVLDERLQDSPVDIYALSRLNVGRNHDDLTFEAALTGLIGRVRRARQSLRGRMPAQV